MRMRGRSTRLFGVLSPLVVLVALHPTARAAATGEGRSPAFPTPLEQAFTGGLAVLRAPASTMIRVARSRFVVGSTPEQVLAAMLSCSREPLAYRCTERSFSNELPAETATLPPFLLDRSEVTRGDFERCVARGACERHVDTAPLDPADADLPVTMVRAADAEAYCRARGARLPSEREVERAARGTLGRLYPWGNLWNGKLANHGRLGLDPSDDTDGYAELAPVGSFASGRTPDGFFDLAGNAAEWTSDDYGERSGAPPSPTAGGARVVRGGHYLNGHAWLRGATRGSLPPSERAPTIGFRCARSLGGVR